MRFDGKRFVELLREAEYSPRSYSGRAMYGRSCVGVEIDGNVSASAIGARMALAILAEHDDVFEAESEIERLSTALEGESSDSLGLGTIVYWPRIEWPDGEDEDDDDDE